MQEDERTHAEATSREDEQTHAATTSAAATSSDGGSSSECEDEMPSKVPKVSRQLPDTFLPILSVS